MLFSVEFLQQNTSRGLYNRGELPGKTQYITCQGPNWNHLVLEQLDQDALYAEVVYMAQTNGNLVDELEHGYPAPSRRIAR